MSGAAPAGGGSPSPMRVDAHQHFWEIESGAYAWPTPAHGAIYRTFTPADLAPEIMASHIDRTVLVQTVNTLADTDSMLATASRTPWIGGVVGWAPLDGRRAVARELDARSGSALRGIRHLIHHEADPEWVVRPAVIEGLRELEERGLPFDIVAVFPEHLRLVPRLADVLPALTLVIDHLANPPYRADGWDTWRDQLQAAAARPNVFAKISGLSTAAGTGWTPEEILPGIEAALEAFGASRLIFGSDWPVCLLLGSYGGDLTVIEGLLGSLSPTERAAVMGGTACRVYRLG